MSSRVHGSCGTKRHDFSGATTALVKLSVVQSGALTNQAAAAESIAQDVQAPSDKVADAIAEVEAEANGLRKAPAK